jgi:hypothetical protein
MLIIRTNKHTTATPVSKLDLILIQNEESFYSLANSEEDSSTSDITTIRYKDSSKTNPTPYLLLSERKILEVVSSSPEPIRPGRVADILKCKFVDVRKDMTNMYHKGFLCRNAQHEFYVNEAMKNPCSDITTIRHKQYQRPKQMESSANFMRFILGLSLPITLDIRGKAGRKVLKLIPMNVLQTLYNYMGRLVFHGYARRIQRGVYLIEAYPKDITDIAVKIPLKFGIRHQ